MSPIDQFGTILKQLRKLRGLTQEDLAQRTGRSVDAVSQWERGVNWPSFDTLVRLSEALDVPAATFFETCIAETDDRFERKIEARLLIESMTDRQLDLATSLLRVLALQDPKSGI
jgi:transcriptional regulator with XRE-family HTH domain